MGGAGFAAAGWECVKPLACGSGWRQGRVPKLPAMNPTDWVRILGLLLILAGVGVVRKQLRARSCALHDRRVGWVAWALAVVCLVAGFYLAVKGGL